MKYLKSFDYQLRIEDINTSHVAARLIEALYISADDRVEARVEYDRGGRGYRFRGHSCRATERDNCCDLPLVQRSGQIGQPLLPKVAPTIFDREISPLDIAHFSQTGLYRCKSGSS